MDPPWLPCKRAVINIYIWCAVGAILGWLMGSMLGKNTKTTRVEEVLVGMFGAFVGGEFAADMFRGSAPVESQSFIFKLVLAIACAVVLLVLLALLRRSAGPLQNSKSRSRNRN